MESDPCDPALIKIARQRARHRLGFYTHLIMFVIMNLVYAYVWWINGDGFPWFLFVFVFWGVGLALHGGIAFEGLHIVDRMTERELHKLSQKGYAMIQQQARKRRQLQEEEEAKELES